MSKISIDIDLWRVRTFGLTSEQLKAFTQLIFMMREKCRVSEVYVVGAWSQEMMFALRPCFDRNEGIWTYPDSEKMIKSDSNRRLNGVNGGRPKTKLVTSRLQVETKSPTKSAKPQSEATQKKKAETLKITSLFTKLNDIYFEWFEGEFDIKPDFDGSDGRALKELIKFLEKQHGDSEESFRYILNNWDKLDDFTQKKSRIRDIKANINSIITQFKNGASKNDKSDSASKQRLAKAFQREFSKEEYRNQSS